jgi:renalase
VAAALLAASHLGCAALPDGTQVQRWRYARPITVHSARYLEAQDLPQLLFGGDAFGGAKVEGAVLSGKAAAERLAVVWAGRSQEQLTTALMTPTAR